MNMGIFSKNKEKDKEPELVEVKVEDAVKKAKTKVDEGFPPDVKYVLEKYAMQVQVENAGNVENHIVNLLIGQVAETQKLRKAIDRLYRLIEDQM